MSSQDPEVLHWHSKIDLNRNNFEIHGRTLLFVIILFAVIVLVTILVLFTRRLCRYQHHYFPSHQPSHMPHAPPQPPGLHPTIIRAMPITLHHSSPSSPSSECCICLGVFDDGDKVKELPVCRHFFHSECLDRWLAAGSSCPLCRASLHDGGSALVSILTE